MAVMGQLINMQIEPEVRNDWSCEDLFSVSVSECLVVICCYPCVYASALSRELSIVPTQPRSLCSISPGGAVGILFPPIAGIIIRARQMTADSCGHQCVNILQAILYETCCCFCVGAPCAMNEYRCEPQMSIGTLLLNENGEFVVVDDRHDSYIADNSRLENTPCQTSLSPEVTPEN